MTQTNAEQARHGATWLMRGGLRPTRQRLVLADLLVGDGCHRHVTAESLFAAAEQAGERVSLATVYNTLRAFCEAGLMQEVVVDGDCVIGRMASVRFTMRRPTENFLGRLTAGEPIVRVYRGPGKLLLNPTFYWRYYMAQKRGA